MRYTIPIGAVVLGLLLVVGLAYGMWEWLAG